MKFTLSAILALALWAIPTPAMPHNGTSPNLEKRLGINCRGSGGCNAICGIKLIELIHQVAQVDDDEEFGNGEHVACKHCVSCTHCRTHPSICVFPQNLKDGEKVPASRVKKALSELRAHGCEMCGSNPIKGHNDVKRGEITVNYVTLRKNEE